MFEKVRAVLDRVVPFDVRTTKSQVALRRRRGFAYIWIPGRYLHKPAAEVVLSIALGRYDDSLRFKQVSHPAPGIWMHHLEIHHLTDIDDRSAHGYGRRPTAPADREVRARRRCRWSVSGGPTGAAASFSAARPGAGNGAKVAVH